MQYASAIRAARTLTAARRAGTRVADLPVDATPATLEEGYLVQDLAVAFLGERVAAWKVGATHPNAQAALGVPGPVAARLFASRVFRGDQELADRYQVRGLEAEYAFLMAADLPPRDQPYSREEIAAAVASVHPAIEVVEPRFSTVRQGPLAVADNVFDGAWTHGAGIVDWQALDLVHAPVTMEVDGEVVVRGSGAEVLGDPMASLQWLVNEHAGRREGVRAGQYITTGSCTGLYKAPPGCTARATFGPLGALEVRFVA